MRLTDWIIQRVERTMPQPKAIPIRIPADLPFSALGLTRTPSGEMEFDWEPIRQICEASGIPVETFTESDEAHVVDLLVQWYRHHLAAGGEPDPTMADIIAETAIEDAHGQHVSHQPGRA